VDPSSEPGRGIAYANSDPYLLLNVRAANMSAYPDDPGHFANWLVKNRHSDQASAARVFASRSTYGSYLGEVLSSSELGSDGVLTFLRDQAESIVPSNRLSVTTVEGARIEADRVILATGNTRPCCPSSLSDFSSHPRFAANPWEANAFDDVGPEETIFVVGTGLTMVDALIRLESRSHRGKVFARSRRGLLPNAHKACPPTPFVLSPSGVEVFKVVSRLLRAAGDDWRSSLDGVRPQTVTLWKSLSWADRSRFLKRLRPFWDVFRHRVPESQADLIERWRKSGQLDVGAGRITSVTEECGRFKIAFVGENEPIFADRIVNCTGPAIDVRSEKVPILESVVSAGLSSYDPLGLGLMVDDIGRTDSSGRVWAIGPLCRGCFWETTAIPEIRTQAETIASQIFGPD
jgi:uncharacterized NAD(P)/FAD-binding protein YdhS